MNRFAWLEQGKRFGIVNKLGKFITNSSWYVLDYFQEIPRAGSAYEIINFTLNSFDKIIKSWTSESFSSEHIGDFINYLISLLADGIISVCNNFIYYYRATKCDVWNITFCATFPNETFVTGNTKKENRLENWIACVDYFIIHKLTKLISRSSRTTQTKNWILFFCSHRFLFCCGTIFASTLSTHR